MAMLGNTKETLTERVSRIRSMMLSSACGPLIAARDVVALADSWEEYQAEAEGLSCTAWLRKYVHPKGLPWFRVRDEAVQILGEDIRRTFHHEVAVWFVNNVPEPQRQVCKDALLFAWARRYKKPLSLGQAVPIVRGIIGRSARTRTCGRCEQLEKLLVEHGIEVPGVSCAGEGEEH